MDKLLTSTNQGLSATIQMPSQIRNYNINMQRDEPPKRKASDQKPKRNESDEEDDGSSVSDHYESSFVANDSEVEDEGIMGYRPNFSGDESGSSRNKKKSKKDKKKGKHIKKEKKAKRRKDDEESYDEDDLDLIDGNNKLTRLKKKKEHRESEQEDENFGEEHHQFYDDDDYNSQENDVEEYSDVGKDDDQEEQHSKMNQFIDGNKQLFDPFDLTNLALAQQDREIVELDLPERYAYLMKKNIRGQKRNISQMMDTITKEQLDDQKQWIYARLRHQGHLQSYNMLECQDRILQIINCYHREHLDSMYIFYYRKKLFSDYISLQVLWKIIQLDEEYQQFKERRRKIMQFLQTFLASYCQVPAELKDFIKFLPQTKQLKYFEDYEKFKLTRHAGVSIIQKDDVAMEDENKQKLQYKQKLENNQQEEKRQKEELKVEKKTKKGKTNRFEFITQIAQRGVIDQLQNSHIFLTPRDFCFNLNRKNQEKKPRSPLDDPKVQFERYMKCSNTEADRNRFPLLYGQSRTKTILKYLGYELFSYPEMRKILRDKYYKKLVISTNPTGKGNQDIDLYSQYFPVKRIRDKPVSTLRRETWILAREAERLGHIRIELKFEWEHNSIDRNEKTISIQRDQVYMDIVRQYFDCGNSKSSEMWNLCRKKILCTLLYQYFIPTFMKEIKEDLTRQGQKEIIQACSAKLKSQLNKGPSLKEGKPIKILALVLEDMKLGVAFVDEAGRPLHTFQTIIANETQLKDFVGGQNLKYNIKQYKPDMILIAANCKKAQTLRKELRSQDFNSQSIFCAFGQYEIPRLVAKKKIIQGFVEEESIIEAISMARLKKNPMAEIISLWSDKMPENGILSMNLHPYQRFISQFSLKQSLEKVIIQSVNLVGLDLNQVKKNQHLQSQVQFVSGLGPKKAKHFLERLKDLGVQVLSRRKIEDLVRGTIVAKNCAPFFKIETQFHRNLLQRIQKLQRQKKGSAIPQFESINMLDMTRIPEEWYDQIFKKLSTSYKPTLLSQMRSKKQYSKLADQSIFLLQIFKNHEKINDKTNDKIKSIDWRVKQNDVFDEQLIKNELTARFKNPRDKQRVMENNQIFYNLLRESPDTLKRYMIMPVKVLSVKKNYLNVIITQNGLFGYIKLQSNKSAEDYQKIYEKGMIIKAIIIGFPFDQRNQAAREQGSNQQQELLKVQMSLDFPHKDSDRHEGSRHDCMQICFPSIVKQLHPIIDLDKDRFQLKKEDKPIIENKEEREKVQMPKNISKPDFRRISHPKFKNISAQPAIEMMKSASNGDYVIRPSSQGPEYLTITWKFFGKVVVHIKVKCQHRGMNSMNMTYRIEDKDNRSYNSLQEIVQKFIKPMNSLVQDVTSNRKFLDRNLQQIQNTIKRDMIGDSSHIHYFFAVSEDFPQYFLLLYMYKDKKPIRQLIKVKSSGLYFHQQQFSTIRDLIAWFKQHLKEKEYQKYVKNMTAQLQKMK